MSYEEFIQNILNTRGRFACGEEYHERHHIKPRCLGGTDEEENLIDLFAREHFIAHKLLTEENPDNSRLAYAWWMLSNIGDREITPDEYEQSKIIFSNKLKEIFKNPENHPMFGKHQSEESKRKSSESHKGKYNGENNPNYGNYWTDKQKRYMSEIKSNLSQETRDKMRESQKRRLANPESNPMFGKHHSEESKQKIGWASRNRSPEVYKKISQKAKKRYMGVGSPSFNPVVKLTLDDILVDIFYTAKQVDDELHISATNITECCNGKQKSAGGYRWKRLYDKKLKNGEIISGAITLGIITEEEALKQLEQNSKCKEDK